MLGQSKFALPTSLSPIHYKRDGQTSSPPSALMTSTSILLLALIINLWLTLQIAAQITNPTGMPGWTDLRVCVQCALGVPGPCIAEQGVTELLGCSEYTCACEHFTGALSYISTQVVNYCTSTQDVQSATSFWSAFCAQLITTPLTSPLTFATSTATPAIGATTVMVTITPSCKP